MAIKKIKISDGREIVIDEWLHWPAFSTFDAAAGASVDLRLFSYVVGGRVPQAGAPPGGRRNATETDTNWVARSRVNHDEAYLFYSMTYEVFALENNEPFENQPADLQAVEPIFRGTNLRILQEEMLLEFYVGADISKPQASAPLDYYGQGVGAVAYGSGDALTINQGGASLLELNYGTGGPVSPRNQRTWALPIYVHSDRVAYARVTTPRGQMPNLDQGYRMRVYADGMKQRPVA